MREYVNDNGYLNININERRTPSETGITHSVSVNMFGLDKQSGDLEDAYKKADEDDDGWE